MIKIVYAANILVAGWIGVWSLLFPRYSASIVFSNSYQHTELIRLIGALWFSIAVLSVFGIFRPIEFSPVLLLQLIYKGAWLLVVAWPAYKNNQPFPVAMAWFFIVWVLVLPWFIPWKQWMG